MINPAKTDITAFEGLREVNNVGIFLKDFGWEIS